MSYFSTRGGAFATASQAILKGLAPDGGLFVPSMFPPVSLEEISAMADMDYIHRAVFILKLYLEDFSEQEILDAVTAAYDPAKFDDPAIAPVREIADNTAMLELYHGPTLAFKDMALQLLPHLTTLSARKNGENREISILVATSGDTGKAALEGFRDVPGTSCTVFYPNEGVSPVQQLQMTTTGGANTHVIAVDGNFDDAQTGVKELFASPEFNAEINGRGKVLSSANSINFGRLVPQVVYYFSAYCDLVKQGKIHLGDEVNFCVPTGNFGDILAGYYARNMGLPVRRLICASNRNDVLTDFFNKGGVYDVRRTFFKTMSPSMDILVSSNLERLLFEACDRDGALVKLWMEQLKTCGSYAVGEQRLEWMRSVFSAGCTEEDECAEEIRLTQSILGVLMDTHTAVASRVLRKYRRETGDDTYSVIVSTASPYKFARDVLSAIEQKPTALDAFDASTRLEELTGMPVPQQVKELRSLPVLHTARCARDKMAEAVLKEFDK